MAWSFGLLVYVIHKEQRRPTCSWRKMVLNGNHTIGNATGDTWSYAAPWLTLHWHDGSDERVDVERGAIGKIGKFV